MVYPVIHKAYEGVNSFLEEGFTKPIHSAMDSLARESFLDGNDNFCYRDFAKRVLFCAFPFVGAAVSAAYGTLFATTFLVKLVAFVFFAFLFGSFNTFREKERVKNEINSLQESEWEIGDEFRILEKGFCELWRNLFSNLSAKEVTIEGAILQCLNTGLEDTNKKSLGTALAAVEKLRVEDTNGSLSLIPDLSCLGNLKKLYLLQSPIEKLPEDFESVLAKLDIFYLCCDSFEGDASLLLSDFPDKDIYLTSSFGLALWKKDKNPRENENVLPEKSARDLITQYTKLFLRQVPGYERRIFLRNFSNLCTSMQGSFSPNFEESFLGILQNPEKKTFLFTVVQEEKKIALSEDENNIVTAFLSGNESDLP